VILIAGLFYLFGLTVRCPHQYEDQWERAVQWGGSQQQVHNKQGVTKRCRLSWLTNSALVYYPKCEGGGGKWGGGLGGLSQWVQLYTWSPNKLGRSTITPYLTHDYTESFVYFSFVLKSSVSCRSKNLKNFLRFSSCLLRCSYLPVLSKTETSLYGTVTWLINVLTELTVAVINH
jgi:hypothetical protein